MLRADQTLACADAPATHQALHDFLKCCETLFHAAWALNEVLKVVALSPHLPQEARERLAEIVGPIDDKIEQWTGGRWFPPRCADVISIDSTSTRRRLRPSERRR
jgi:hypothetical protein